MTASEFFSHLGFIIPAGILGSGGGIAALYPIIKNLLKFINNKWPKFKKVVAVIHEITEDENCKCCNKKKNKGKKQCSCDEKKEKNVAKTKNLE